MFSATLASWTAGVSFGKEGQTVVNLDLRMRSDASFQTLDFVAFHEDDLPALLRSGHGDLAARGVAVLGLQPLALQVDGRCYTYAAGNGTLSVQLGDRGAATVAALSPQPFSDLMQDHRSTI